MPDPKKARWRFFPGAAPTQVPRQGAPPTTARSNGGGGANLAEQEDVYFHWIINWSDPWAIEVMLFEKEASDD